MSKLKKIFSKKLPEYIIRYLNKKTGKIITAFNKRKNELNDKHWNEKFIKNSLIVFDINNNLRINLYKDSVLSRLIYEGFEKNELEFMSKVLRVGDILIDVGANIGLFSLIASKIVGQSGKVISFEPSPATFNRLQENISLNNLKNIDSRNIGLSNKKGILSLNVSENGFDAWNTFAKGDIEDKFQKIVDVNVSTLDETLIDIDKAKISFIKIDVEGWEKFVFEGGKEFLKDYSPTVMVEFTEANTFAAGYHVHELFDIMVSLNYKWYRYEDGNLNLEKKRLHYPYDNLIATKDIELLNKKLN